MIWENNLRDFLGNILRGLLNRIQGGRTGLPLGGLCRRAFERLELLRAHLEDGRPLAAIAREARLSYRTLQYWLERYRTSGLAALAHKPRTDRGRRRKLSAALLEVIEGLALQKPPLPIRVVCNRARLATERLGEEPPGYDLVHDVSQSPADRPRDFGSPRREGLQQLFRASLHKQVV